MRPSDESERGKFPGAGPLGRRAPESTGMVMAYVLSGSYCIFTVVGKVFFGDLNENLPTFLPRVYGDLKLPLNETLTKTLLRP